MTKAFKILAIAVLFTGGFWAFTHFFGSEEFQQQVGKWSAITFGGVIILYLLFIAVKLRIKK